MLIILRVRTDCRKQQTGQHFRPVETAARYTVRDPFRGSLHPLPSLQARHVQSYQDTSWFKQKWPVPEIPSHVHPLTMRYPTVMNHSKETRGCTRFSFPAKCSCSMRNEGQSVKRNKETRDTVDVRTISTISTDASDPCFAQARGGQR